MFDTFRDENSIKAIATSLPKRLLKNFDKKEFFEILRWPGFQKVGMKYWNVGLAEMYRSLSKRAFTRALQKLIPRITINDLEPSHSGVRAQACHRKTGLLDDFYFVENPGIINVCNAPSPAATSSISLGDVISNKAIKRLSL